MTTRFRITPARGQSVTGVVQGAGGPVQSLERLQGARRVADEGRPRGLYEPSPGHVRVFPFFDAMGNGAHIDVCIVGARIEQEIS